MDINRYECRPTHNEIFAINNLEVIIHLYYKMIFLLLKEILISEMIIIICGLPGVGKTTIAKELAPLVNAVILSTDKIRKRAILQTDVRMEGKKIDL